MKINATEIKPGDLVAEYGLIIKVDHEGEDKFWSGKPNVNFICVHDAYHGSCSSQLFYDKQYELIEGEERAEWIKGAKVSLNEHMTDLQEDLQTIESIELIYKKIYVTKRFIK